MRPVGLSFMDFIDDASATFQQRKTVVQLLLNKTGMTYYSSTPTCVCYFAQPSWSSNLLITDTNLFM